jgi:hypothetical protein
LREELAKMDTQESVLNNIIARIYNLRMLLVQKQLRGTLDQFDECFTDNLQDEPPPSEDLIDDLALHITGLTHKVDEVIWCGDMDYANSFDIKEFCLRNDLEEKI